MITTLLEIQNTLLSGFKGRKHYSRTLYKHINLDNRFVGLVGARGVGKTTYLLQLVQNSETSLYVSADNVFFLEHSLLELVDTLYKETDIRTLCIDEIHKYPNWNQELKNIYDTYLEFKIIFTGSSAIDLTRSKYDLSRRVVLYSFYGFSFREYLAFNDIATIDAVTLNDILEKPQEILSNISLANPIKQFKDYLRFGYYPFSNDFSQRVDFYQAIRNIHQKSIYEDIGTAHQLKTGTLLVLEKLFKYVLNSVPGELSVYKVASALGKDFKSISEYVRYLEEAGLLRCLRSSQIGKGQLKNPEKLLPDNPNMIYAELIKESADILGNIRESFALSHLQNAGLCVFYQKIGDFYVEGKTLEIGGKNKTRRQIKGVEDAYVLSDDTVTAFKNTLPLWLLGILY